MPEQARRHLAVLPTPDEAESLIDLIYDAAIDPDRLGTLIDNWETGIFVPVDDAATMGKAIRNLLEDDELRRRIARQGRQAYKKDFTEKKVVTQYMDFFESVLEATRGATGETDKNRGDKAGQGAP